MNENYSCKVQQILNEGRRCKEQLPVIGPTGPTGPAGAATITVGSTTTTDPGTNASVTNAGTSDNVILNFSIPRGATGPTGPQGEIGPTGPAGAEYANEYASIYSTANDNITLTQDVLSTIPLVSTGPNQTLTPTPANNITVPETGTYKIDYFFQGATSTNGELTLEVTQNANPINSTSIIKDATANVDESIYGSAIVNLTANDQIGLGLSSSVAATVTPSSGTNAYLNIIKLS